MKKWIKWLIGAVIFVTVVILGINGRHYIFSGKMAYRGYENKIEKIPDVSKECSGVTTPSSTEGPYYKSLSPKKNNFLEAVTPGERIIVTGYVFDKNCKPIANAWVDFWQADAEGNYDNTGYRFRGHQLTDSNGRYQLETVVPGEYPGRTPHIHVKVRANETSPILTSQLYFPETQSNAGDSIFTEQTVLKFQSSNGKSVGTYNFVLP